MERTGDHRLCIDAFRMRHQLITNQSELKQFYDRRYNGHDWNLPAAMEQQVDLSGASGPMPSKTITTSTSRTLVVKVTALAAQNLTIPGYQNWVFPYGCLQVNVNVNGSTQTALMQVANVAQGSSSPCAGAPAFKVLNFSNVMSGSGPTTVTITNPVYDNCRTYNPFYYGCYMSAVWMNHIVAANVTVQVDGTWMDTTIP